MLFAFGWPHFISLKSIDLPPYALNIPCCLHAISNWSGIKRCRKINYIKHGGIPALCVCVCVCEHLCHTSSTQRSLISNANRIVVMRYVKLDCSMRWVYFASFLVFTANCFSLRWVTLVAFRLPNQKKFFFFDRHSASQEIAQPLKCQHILRAWNTIFMLRLLQYLRVISKHTHRRKKSAFRSDRLSLLFLFIANSTFSRRSSPIFFVVAPSREPNQLERNGLSGSCIHYMSRHNKILQLRPLHTKCAFNQSFRCLHWSNV